MDIFILTLILYNYA